MKKILRQFNTILKKLLVKLIKIYQRYISAYTRRHCVFYPTCSSYTIQAIEKYGPAVGVWKGLGRILRCHPWQKNHIDPLI